MLGIVFAGVALTVRLRAGRQLRRPTNGELDDMAKPLGRAAARHADTAWLHPDLIDVIAVGSAVGAWANSGPLTTQAAPDAGVPANLQEDL